MEIELENFPEYSMKVKFKRFRSVSSKIHPRHSREKQWTKHTDLIVVKERRITWKSNSPIFPISMQSSTYFTNK